MSFEINETLDSNLYPTRALSSTNCSKFKPIFGRNGMNQATSDDILKIFTFEIGHFIQIESFLRCKQSTILVNSEERKLSTSMYVIFQLKIIR